jgi:hypothetical protein
MGRWWRGLGLAVALGLAAGCSVTVGTPSAYTEEELRAECERTGGWWRGDLIANFCEYQSPGNGFL